MTSRGFVSGRGARAGLLLVHLALLVPLVASWWAGRTNHLFSDGRWIAGKDTGKFVFYTYEFLFHPLGESGVDLAGHMGFQEILYREPEGPGRRLRRLELEAQISDGAYLWIGLRVAGERRLAFRLSRNRRYPGGTYEFDETGARVRSRPFAERPFVRAPGWRRIELALSDGRWELRVDGERLDAVEDVAWKDGRPGFRGSGPVAGPVRVRDVRMTFADETGASWTERSRWSATPGTGALLASFAFAVLALALRALAREVLARGLAAERRPRFLAAGDAALALFVATGLVVPLAASGVAIAAGLAALAPVDLALLAWLRRGAGGEHPVVVPPALAAAAVALTLGVLGAALARHGEALGRALPHGPPMLSFVHPAAYRLDPDRASPSPPFELREPVRVVPAEPFFVEGHAWREQLVEATIVLARETTLDLVLEQRSFRTLGDLDGEALPHSRRLLRLTTRDDVPWGLATRTGNRPGPFRALGGRIAANEPTELSVRSDGGSVIVRLNGVETVRSGLPALGFGETGFLVHEGEGEIRRLRVSSLASPAAAVPWSAVAPPLALAAFAWALLGRFVSGRAAAALEAATLLPLSLYAAAAAVAPAADWGLLGRDRFAWLDLAAAATFVSHAALLVVSSRRDARAALLFNALALGAVASLALFAWDRLPESHALRLRFAGAAIAPGETVPAAADGAPWYADDRSIGANTWVWKQRPGGEEVSPAKRPGITRLVVLGGSQAWGSGAASSAETFAELLEKRLRDAGLAVEVLNGGINGAGISRAALAWEGIWRRLEPDVLVVDVGLNDSSALRQIRDRSRWGARIRALAQDLDDLLRRCHEDGVDVVLVQEPIAAEAPLRAVPRLYAAFERTAKRRGASVVDPRPAIRALERDHLVWWDTAHFAPFGHSTLAAEIAPEVERVVRSRLAAGSPNT